MHLSSDSYWGLSEGTWSRVKMSLTRPADERSLWSPCDRSLARVPARISARISAQSVTSFDADDGDISWQYAVVERATQPARNTTSRRIYRLARAQPSPAALYSFYFTKLVATDTHTQRYTLHIQIYKYTNTKIRIGGVNWTAWHGKYTISLIRQIQSKFNFKLLHAHVMAVVSVLFFHTYRTFSQWRH